MNELEQTREKYCKQLAEFKNILSKKQKKLLTVDLDISMSTLVKYISGDIKEIRKLETALQIIEYSTKMAKTLG